MKPLSIAEVRERYLAFFEGHGHTRIPSASLVPENDPTTLFTGSGMQPLLPHLLGESHPSGTRVTDSQLCFRSEDIDEVGDNRHTTFFEMLGNWSFGDYFKAEQISWLWEFLTDPTAGLGLDPNRLYITAFAGAPEYGVPQDNEAAELWQKQFAEKNIEAPLVVLGSEAEAATGGMQGGRIFFYDATKNWWSRSGVPENMPPGEPGGPDSEVFFDFGTPHDPTFGEQCHPNCDCGRFMEIGNSVFMEFQKEADGSFQPLPQKNVDFGGGLERLTAAVADNADVFQVDVMKSLLELLSTVAKKPYADTVAMKSYRVIADHLRASVFMISEGILPSNTEQGYYVRRLLRRAVRHADLLELPAGYLANLVAVIVESYRKQYPHLLKQQEDIQQKIREEEERFRKTLTAGLREFTKLTTGAKEISGKQAFTLFTTYGFPLDMTIDLAEEQGLTVDTEEFEQEFTAHQDKSRAGAEKKFKGGLADHSEKSIHYHTATHLLHQALQDELGPDAIQQGSNITPERLRFDFSHGEKLTPEQIATVEKRVNEQIQAKLPVTKVEMSVAEAKAVGALGLFEDRYADNVNVYRMGDYSVEICGGPHVKSTGELGIFKIVKEESAGANIRRIKAILE